MGLRKFIGAIAVKLGIRAPKRVAVVDQVSDRTPLLPRSSRLSLRTKISVKRAAAKRFEDTAFVIYQDYLKEVKTTLPDLFDKAAYSEGYLIFGTTRAITSYANNGNKTLILYRP